MLAPKRKPSQDLVKSKKGQLMQNPVIDLATALRERLAIIHDEESRRDEKQHIARLRAVSEKIGKLQAALPKPVDPRLVHFLQRQSYDKALEFLEQGDPSHP
jgi:hypothetical protein